MLSYIMQEDIRQIIQKDNIFHKLCKKNILITGATGFIGSFLVHTLLFSAEKQNHIIALVRNKEKALIMFQDYYERGQISFLVQDIRNPLNIDESIDYVIHCASNAAPKEYEADPAGTMTTNFIGTYQLLEFARTQKIEKFLYVSTIEIYGNANWQSPIKEDDYGIHDASNIRSCYPLSKKACETMSLSYGKQYNIPVVIGRLGYIFGPGMHKNDSKVVAQFARDTAAGKSLILKSSGMQRRSYCYISDAVSGLLTILLFGNCQESYNIASDQCVTTIYDMAQAYVSLFPGQDRKVIREQSSVTDQKLFSPIADAVLSTEKIDHLGWKAEIGLKEGLRRFVLSLKEGKNECIS